jgi:hypothetical protein
MFEKHKENREVKARERRFDDDMDSTEMFTPQCVGCTYSLNATDCSIYGKKPVNIIEYKVVCPSKKEFTWD